MFWRTCPGFPDYEISKDGRVRRDTPNPTTPNHQELDEITDAELAKAMKDHVRKRGGPSLNGAWAMMLEASERLARWHAWAARYYERCEISENNDDVYDVSLANKVLSQRGSHD
jgi:hypothetical protein